jgi:hypothetical protein
MNKQTGLLLLIASICACLVSGCAGNGNQTYHSAMASLTPQPGRGLVLIYYKDGVGGHAARWRISANDQLLTDNFRRGCFYAYQAAPGTLVLATSVKPTHIPVAIVMQAAGAVPNHHKPIQVEANQTYWLPIKAGAFRERLEPVSKEEGERDIQDCHWLNPTGN